jgi:hypothetical protein
MASATELRKMRQRIQRTLEAGQPTAELRAALKKIEARSPQPPARSTRGSSLASIGGLPRFETRST